MPNGRKQCFEPKCPYEARREEGKDPWYCADHDTKEARDARKARTKRESRARLAARAVPDVTLTAAQVLDITARLVTVRSYAEQLKPLLGPKLDAKHPAVLLVNQAPQLLDAVLDLLEV